MSHVFFDFIEQKLAPLAAKIGSQRHICAIRDGFISALPFMIVGSFLLLLAFPPFSPDTSFVLGKWWVELAQTHFDQIMTPFNVSMGIMSCYIATGIAYNLAQSYRLDAFPTAMLSLMTFLLVAAPIKAGAIQNAFLNSTGVFSAILVAIYSVELTRFLKNHSIIIKLPEQVPHKISQSFALLLPALVIIMTIYPLNLMLLDKFGMPLPEAIMALFKPLILASDTLPAILLATFIAHVLWFAGIHGAAIVGGIMAPFYLINLGMNQEALAAGTQPPAIFAEPFWSFFIVLGGSGSTFALVLLYLRSKSIYLRSIGKLSFVPSIFNINEPIIFGSPIVMNPILFIPFVGIPMVNAIIAYVATTTNMIGNVVSLVPWTSPAPIGASWSAGWNINNGLLILFLIILDLALYYPFFKIYEKQLSAQEKVDLQQ